MNKILYLIIFLLFIPKFALAFSSEESNLIERIVGSVDGEPITLSELNRFISSIESTTLDKNSMEVRSEALRDLIISILLKNEAKRLGVTVTEKEVEAYVNEVTRQNNLTISEFTKLLKEQGLTFELYKEQIKREITRSRIVSREVQSRITISDQDVMRYLEQNPSTKPKPGSVRIIQFAVPFSEDLEETKSITHSLYSQVQLLSSSDKFEISTLPTQFYSDLGYVNVSDLRAEIAEVLPTDGDLSDVIKTEGGFIFFYIASRTPEDGGVSKQHMEQVREMLFNQRYQNNLNNYLNVELPERYVIEMNL